MVYCGSPGASVRVRTRLSLGARRVAYPEAGNVGTTRGALVLTSEREAVVDFSL
jgi:hypothetical protein